MNIAFSAQRRKSRGLVLLAEPLERRTLLNATPQGPEFQVHTYTPGNQLNSSVAMDNAGNFVVVWQSPVLQGGHLDEILAQRFAADGTPLGNEFRVNTTTSGNQQEPAVAMDSDGDFVVVWHGPADGGADLKVWGQRFGPLGAPQGTEFRVNEVTTNNQFNATVAMDDSGAFVVAWASRDQVAGTSNYDIFARRYTAAGAAVAGEFLVNTFTTNPQNNPAVAMDSDGDFVIAWNSFGQDLSNNGVYAQLFNNAGEPVGMEFLVNQFTTGHQRSPATAMDSAGNFVIAWESTGQDGGGYGVYARRYSSAGAALADEFRVNTATADHQRVPAVATDSDGDFVITWASRLQDGAVYGIYAQCYNAAGLKLGPEFRVNTFTTNTQYNPSIAMDVDGDFVVTWQSNLQDGPTEGFGIYGQRFSSGGAVDPPTVIGAAFVWENAPQRIEYGFTADVEASLSTDDLMIQNLDTMEVVPASHMSMTYQFSNEATFTFPGYPRGALPDGNYRATLVAVGVTDINGTPLPEDHVIEFFFLMADANHDRTVNLSDFNRLAANFGQSPRNFIEGDFNYDGVVNLLDFNLLAGRFGNELPPPMMVQRSPSPFAGRTTIGSGKDRLDELA